ncbi:MAG: lipid II:glycine glycyltransferase FemX [Flavisolibacter sp.]
MSNITIVDPIKDSRWDKFVENHPFGWIVHLSGWKTVLENSFPHIKGHYLALLDPQSNELIAGLPIFEVRSWLTGSRLVSIPFATICDPLVSNTQEMEVLLNEGTRLLEKLKFSFLEIKTLRTTLLIDNKNFADQCYFKHNYLELSEGPEALWKNFNYKAVRYEINKAQKHKLVIRVASSENDFLSFYKLYTLTRKRLGLPSQPYLFFKTIWDTFSPAGNVTILLAELEKNIIAAHLLLQFNGRVSAEAVGWDISYSKASPNHFLFWEGIKLACEKGFRVYDFGRTSLNNQPLLDFKKRWGTQIIDLHSFYYPIKSHRRVVNREASKSYRLVRFACQRAPESIYPLIGKFCYRHIG